MAVSPATITADAGGATSFTVSITSQNGFADPVSVTFSGLPDGATVVPAAPFSVAASGSQAVTLSIPSAATAGNFNVMANGTAGALAHSAALALTVQSAKDFSVSTAPDQVAVTLGTQSAPVSIAISGQDGFSDAVTVTLSGLPTGVSSSPPPPFTVAPGQGQMVTFSVPSSAAVGNFPIQVGASTGSLSHTSQFGLTVNPIIRTYDTGPALYLETTTANEVTRVGLDKHYGDALFDVSLNGTNYVNSDDPGRYVQTSLWDGNANYATSWGYNPIEAGDHFYDGSPVLDSMLQPDSIYTKTQPIQWAPENFGGGPDNPVVGDAYIEKWLSVVPGYNRVFKVHYKITHFGTDTHAQATNELPVAYVNPIISTFVYYGGSAPWTNDSLTSRTMPSTCCVVLPTAENWAAYVDKTNTGLALYTPMQYPDSKGFNAGSTLQLTPTCPNTWLPGAVLEFDIYILAGPVIASRAAIYQLHQQRNDASPLPPFGNSDSPSTGDILKGNVVVDGWEWALSGMSSVDVYIDDIYVGTATYGLPRPDVATAWPGAPGNTGYQYLLDTTKLPKGPHTMVVKATDKNGKIGVSWTQYITVSN
jgi:hypothetical protein